MKLNFAHAARLERREAVAFYRRRSSSVADAFSSELHRVLQRLIRYPESGVLLEDNLRAARLTDFPYSVIYAITPFSIRVIAIAHESREPGYWNRLR